MYEEITKRQIRDEKTRNDAEPPDQIEILSEAKNIKQHNTPNTATEFEENHAPETVKLGRPNPPQSQPDPHDNPDKQNFKKRQRAEKLRILRSINSQMDDLEDLGKMKRKIRKIVQKRSNGAQTDPSEASDSQNPKRLKNMTTIHWESKRGQQTRKRVTLERIHKTDTHSEQIMERGNKTINLQRGKPKSREYTKSRKSKHAVSSFRTKLNLTQIFGLSKGESVTQGFEGVESSIMTSGDEHIREYLKAQTNETSLMKRGGENAFYIALTPNGGRDGPQLQSRISNMKRPQQQHIMVGSLIKSRTGSTPNQSSEYAEMILKEERKQNFKKTHPFLKTKMMMAGRQTVNKNRNLNRNRTRKRSEKRRQKNQKKAESSRKAVKGSLIKAKTFGLNGRSKQLTENSNLRTGQKWNNGGRQSLIHAQAQFHQNQQIKQNKQFSQQLRSKKKKQQVVKSKTGKKGNNSEGRRQRAVGKRYPITVPCLKTEGDVVQDTSQVSQNLRQRKSNLNKSSEVKIRRKQNWKSKSGAQNGAKPQIGNKSLNSCANEPDSKKSPTHARNSIKTALDPLNPSGQPLTSHIIKNIRNIKNLKRPAFGKSKTENLSKRVHSEVPPCVYMKSGDSHLKKFLKRAGVEIRTSVVRTRLLAPADAMRYVAQAQTKDYKRLREGQIYNHFEGNEEMTDKGGLNRNMNRREVLSGGEVMYRAVWGVREGEGGMGQNKENGIDKIGQNKGNGIDKFGKINENGNHNIGKIKENGINNIGQNKEKVEGTLEILNLQGARKEEKQLLKRSVLKRELETETNLKFLTTPSKNMSKQEEVAEPGPSSYKKLDNFWKTKAFMFSPEVRLGDSIDANLGKLESEKSGSNFRAVETRNIEIKHFSQIVNSETDNTICQRTHIPKAEKHFAPTYNPSNALIPRDFYPKTFDLSSQDQRERFIESFFFQTTFIILKNHVEYFSKKRPNLVSKLIPYLTKRHKNSFKEKLQRELDVDSLYIPVYSSKYAKLSEETRDKSFVVNVLMLGQLIEIWKMIAQRLVGLENEVSGGLS